MVFIIIAVAIFLCVVTAFLIIGYGRAHRCVYTRSFLWTIITADDPEIPPYFTGTWKRWRVDGSLKEELEVREGVPHGRAVSWHEEGPKASERFYNNGKLDGKFTLWHYNGRKRLESFYKNGAEHGKVSKWDFHGNLVSVTWKYESWIVLTLAGNGSDIPSDFTGTWKTRRADGSVKEQCEVRQGVRHGRFITWHEEEPKASEGFYKNGKPHGKLVLWYTDGRKRDETFYRDGVEHGKVREWDFHGNLLSVTWKYEGRSVSKEEFERLTTLEGNSKEAPGKKS